MSRNTMAIVHRSKAKDEESSSLASEKGNASSNGSAVGMHDSKGKNRHSVINFGMRRRMVPPRFFILLGASLVIVLGTATVLKIRKETGDSFAFVVKTPVLEEPDTIIDHHAKTEPSPLSLLGPETKSMPTRRLTYTERLNHPTVVPLRNCTVSYTAPANLSFPPIWMPSYPASGAASASKKGDLLKPIIDKLTGWTAGSKNYHMSIRNKLKRCHATNTPTAVCTNGHPLTSIGPDKQTQNFHDKVILVLRNFFTAYPAMMQDKAFAYHGAKEQVSKEEWKTSRDEWCKSSFETWKGFVDEWRNMNDYYHIDMYIMYEKIMDPTRGIDEVKRLANQLQAAGLQVAPADQIPCIWYQAVEPEYRRLEHFFKYQPGYTAEIKDFLTREMEKFIQEMTGKDDALVNILKEYLDEIQNDITLDP